MFSKEWFVYVFGRWVVVSGIAGAIVQYLFSDLLHIHTIPAFLLNQLCLACVFWYIDKLIFKRHFKDNLLDFFRFPRIKHAFGLTEQCAMLNREFSDFRSKVSGNEEKPEFWLNEFVDLVHAMEMTELLLRERNIDIDAEIEHVRSVNRVKGLYYDEKERQKIKRPEKSGRDFIEALQKNIMVADGAMGTYLAAQGFGPDMCREQLNCKRPEIILSAHEEYIAAGARLIETNTFGANRLKLAKYGLAGQVREINLAGARLARQAARGRAFVAGSVGPLGSLLSPYGNLSLATAHEVFKEQIQALADGGVDCIIIETMTSLMEAREAVLMCRETCGLPIICQLAGTDTGKTVYGDDLAQALTGLHELGADVVGLNCLLGPQEMLDRVKAIPDTFQGFLSVQPNAGMPVYKNGSIDYPTGPEYFARYVPLFQECGVHLIGGCCGTTPGHIKAMAEAVCAAPQKARRCISTAGQPAAISCEKRHETNPACRGWFEDNLFVTVEIAPPKTVDTQAVLEEIRQLKKAGADAVDITENPMARMHMSALVFCSLVKQQIDIKTILHFTTRDRNLLAIQSDLLGAAAIGIDGILALKGDPASLGDIPNASSVYDVSSTGLITIMHSMNRESLAGACRKRLALAVGANPNAENMNAEIERLRQKIDAGAHMVITQPVYERVRLERFMERAALLQAPVVAGLLPLKNSRQAEYLHNEVPGITIPEPLRRALACCPAADAARNGLEIAAEFADAAAGLVSGFYLMPPKGFLPETLELVRKIKSISMRRQNG